MSYARFGWEGSDVYVIGTVLSGEHVIECCGCLLLPKNPAADDPCPDHIKENEDLFCPGCFPPLWLDPFPRFPTTQGILDHLRKHQEAGHKVLPQTLTEIENDDWL